MGSSSVPYESKRLITKKELEKKVFQQGSKGVSVYAIVAVVYFDSNNSPYHTGKGYIGVTPMGTYNKGRNSDELGWLDDKRKIAYEVNFGEWLENYIRQDSTLPELKGQRSKNIELEVNRAWKGFSFLGGHKPLTKKKRLEILDDFHKTIHGNGLKYLIQEDSLWLSEEDDEEVVEVRTYTFNNRQGRRDRRVAAAVWHEGQTYTIDEAKEAKLASVVVLDREKAGKWSNQTMRVVVKSATLVVFREPFEGWSEDKETAIEQARKSAQEYLGKNISSDKLWDVMKRFYPRKSSNMKTPEEQGWSLI